MESRNGYKLIQDLDDDAPSRKHSTKRHCGWISRKFILVLIPITVACYWAWNSSFRNSFCQCPHHACPPPLNPSINENLSTQGLLGTPQSLIDEDIHDQDVEEVYPEEILFFSTNPESISHSVVIILDSVRLKYDGQLVRHGHIENVPSLEKDSQPQYSLIIFEYISLYQRLDDVKKTYMDNYCRKYDVGMIFLPSIRHVEDDGNFHELERFDLDYIVVPNEDLTGYQLDENSPMLHISRPGDKIDSLSSSSPKWMVFRSRDDIFQTYEYISYLSLRNDTASNTTIECFQIDSTESCGGYSSVILDLGYSDGIKKVIFGEDLHFWMHKMLFMDAITYLTNFKLNVDLNRYIQIDIDDIFVAQNGTRMHADDVQALIEFQSEQREKIPNFQLLLGFSGFYPFHGTEEENAGDEVILQMQSHFKWFPHMWNHSHAHEYEADELCQLMQLNKDFAVDHDFDISDHYAIAPLHAGVFPVHEELYDCWKSIWNISMTSTEEYPHEFPKFMVKGFIYRGIAVLPRRVCGLYTHTLYADSYPGGEEKLIESIEGGELFQTFLFNKINIFMTHFGNYGNGRIAPYTFRRVFDFIEKWTHLKLIQQPPQWLAQKYFELFPEDRLPVWSNPCLDERLRSIWSPNKTCDRLPQFVIVGPQKTGTTALHWFLSMHPNLESSIKSPSTFEEIQFFNTQNYLKGLDWYMEAFPHPPANVTLFEKTANYFDNEITPNRLATLLPKSPIIVVLIDPGDRAYSWYQHMRAHEDAAATQFTFQEILQSKEDETRAWALRRRCLVPGLYATHIENWLKHIPEDNIIFVDGEMLKENPAQVLSQLQHSLHIENIIDYNPMLKYNNQKGFFCQHLPNGSTRCLGKGKGRKYPPMDNESRLFLDKYYASSKIQLRLQLVKLKRTIPKWLIRHKPETVTEGSV